MVFHMGRSLCSPSRLSISVVHCGSPWTGTQQNVQTPWQVKSEAARQNTAMLFTASELFFKLNIRKCMLPMM